MGRKRVDLRSVAVDKYNKRQNPNYSLVSLDLHVIRVFISRWVKRAAEGEPLTEAYHVVAVHAS